MCVCVYVGGTGRGEQCVMVGKGSGITEYMKAALSPPDIPTHVFACIFEKDMPAWRDLAKLSVIKQEGLLFPSYSSKELSLSVSDSGCLTLSQSVCRSVCLSLSLSVCRIVSLARLLAPPVCIPVSLSLSHYASVSSLCMFFLVSLCV